MGEAQLGQAPLGALTARHRTCACPMLSQTPGSEHAVPDSWLSIRQGLHRELEGALHPVGMRRVRRGWSGVTAARSKHHAPSGASPAGSCQSGSWTSLHRLKARQNFCRTRGRWAMSGRQDSAGTNTHPLLAAAGTAATQAAQALRLQTLTVQLPTLTVRAAAPRRLAMTWGAALQAMASSASEHIRPSAW